MAEKPKMFNRAIVFGSVLKQPVLKETKGGSKYASIQLQCPNDLYGDVRAWGKIWGERGEDALEDLKAGDTIRLEGVFQQYKSEKSGLVTNFNFFNFRFCTEKEKSNLRAAFIIVGDVQEVKGIESIGESGAFGRYLSIRYQSKEDNDSPYEPEDYCLFVSKAEALFAEVTPALVGQRVKVKGFLENEEDDFGESTPTRASIKELKTSQNNEEIPF